MHCLVGSLFGCMRPEEPGPWLNFLSSFCLGVTVTGVRPFVIMCCPFSAQTGTRPRPPSRLLLQRAEQRAGRSSRGTQPSSLILKATTSQLVGLLSRHPSSVQQITPRFPATAAISPLPFVESLPLQTLGAENPAVPDTGGHQYRGGVDGRKVSCCGPKETEDKTYGFHFHFYCLNSTRYAGEGQFSIVYTLNTHANIAGPSSICRLTALIFAPHSF